jgi:hypothetical protein
MLSIKKLKYLNVASTMMLAAMLMVSKAFLKDWLVDWDILNAAQ